MELHADVVNKLVSSNGELCTHMKRDDLIQEQELEQYGVWVKAGPEDVMDADETWEEDEEPQTIEQEDAPIFALDEPEALTIGAIDDEEPFTDPTAIPEGLLEDSPSNSTQEEPLVSLDDFDLEEPNEIPDPFATIDPEEGSETPIEAFDIDIPESFDLSEIAEETPPSKPVDPTYDDLTLETAKPEENEALFDAPLSEFDQDSMPGATTQLDDISLDDIYVDDTEQLPELDGSNENPVEEITLEEAAPPIGEELVADPFASFDQLEEPVDEALPEEPSTTIDQFDATLSNEEEAFLGHEPVAEHTDLPNSPQGDIPKRMDAREEKAFQRIQAELSDIKRELADLKDVLRATQAAATPPPPPPERETAAQPEAGSGGFFDEDEDETIALTGDELDNILHTAEFTEQEGQDIELDESFFDPHTTPTSSEPAFEIEGSEDMVDELANLDIEEELSEIAELEDSTDFDDSNEIEIDLSSFDSEVPSPSETVLASEEDPFDQQDPELEEELGSIPNDYFPTPEETSSEPEPLSIDEQELTPREPVEPWETPTETINDDELGADLSQIDISAELDDLPEELIDDTSLPEEPLPAIEATPQTPEEIEAFIAGEQPVTAEEGESSLDTPFEEELSEETVDTLLDEFSNDIEIEDAPTEEEQPLTEAALTEDDFDQFATSVEEDLNQSEEISLDADFDGIENFAVDEQSLPGEAREVESEILLPEGISEREPSPMGAPELATTQGSSHVTSIADLPSDLKQEIRSVLSYMDQLLEALPDDKIEEFAHSEHFEVYKRLFDELGLET